MSEQARLYELAADAWRAFGNAASLPSRVKNAIPILFFGDLRAYSSSKTRVVTVGLNPSSKEFPADCALQRFPLAEGISASEQGRYLQALSAYFCTCPYRRWFSGFEPMLRGMGVSYYEGQPSTALHTDISSPIATEPMWSHLDLEVKKTLEKDGRPLWHSLLEVLRPEVVVFSVASDHLSSFKFEAVTECYLVHVYTKTKNGLDRKQPVKVCAQWFEICGDQSLFFFIKPAAETPLGRLDNSKKQETGVMALEELRRGPIAPD